MLLPYFLLGSAFGVVIVEAEVVSWFRIQEMFRFDAFHMYGIIGTAVLTAAISLLTIKRLGLRGPDSTPLGLAPKRLGTGVQYLAGGTRFRLAWVFTGSCPGPLVAPVSACTTVMLDVILIVLLVTCTFRT